MYQEMLKEFLKYFQGQYGQNVDWALEAIKLLGAINYPGASDLYLKFLKKYDELKGLGSDDILKSSDDIKELISQREDLKAQGKNEALEQLIKQLDDKIQLAILLEILNSYSALATELSHEFETAIFSPLMKDNKLKKQISSILFSFLYFQRFELQKISGVMTKLIIGIPNLHLAALNNSLPTGYMATMAISYVKPKIFTLIDSIVLDSDKTEFFYKEMSKKLKSIHSTPLDLQLSDVDSEEIVKSIFNHTVDIAEASMELEGKLKWYLKDEKKAFNAQEPESIKIYFLSSTLAFSDAVCKFFRYSNHVPLVKDLGLKVSCYQPLLSKTLFVSMANQLFNNLLMDLNKLHTEIRKLIIQRGKDASFIEFLVMMEPVIKTLELIQATHFSLGALKPILPESNMVHMGINLSEVGILNEHMKCFYAWFQLQPFGKINKNIQEELKKIGYIPKEEKITSGNQIKAEASGFYEHEGITYFLKHVSNSDYIADDLAEIMASTILGKGFNAFAQCTIVKVCNEVFIASKSFENFKSIFSELRLPANAPTRVMGPTKVQLESCIGAEKQELSDILAISLWFGDYDCHPGNIGRSHNQLVKIDHGWGFENICANAPMSITGELNVFRSITRTAPLNNMNTYPFIINNADLFEKSVDIISQKINFESVLSKLKDSIKKLLCEYNYTEKPNVYSCGSVSLFSKQEILSKIISRLGLISALFENENENENQIHNVAFAITESLDVRLQLMKIFVQLNRLAVTVKDQGRDYLSQEEIADCSIISLTYKAGIKINEIISVCAKKGNSYIDLIKKRMPNECLQVFNSIHEAFCQFENPGNTDSGFHQENRKNWDKVFSQLGFATFCFKEVEPGPEPESVPESFSLFQKVVNYGYYHYQQQQNTSNNKRKAETPPEDETTAKKLKNNNKT